MNIQTIKKEHMDTLRELADMTIKVSEARESLTKLQSTKDEYLKGMESEASNKIQKLLDDSDSVIEKIHKNNAEVHTLYKTVSSYKAFIDEAFESFKCLLAEFEERRVEWDNKVEKQCKEFGEIEAKAEKDKKEIKVAKEEIEKSQKEVNKQRIKVEDDREMIKRALERIKNNQK